MVPHVAPVRCYIWTHSVLPRKNERRTRLRYAHVPKPNSASMHAEVRGQPMRITETASAAGKQDILCEPRGGKPTTTLGRSNQNVGMVENAKGK